jgi:hypothetical protein
MSVLAQCPRVLLLQTLDIDPVEACDTPEWMQATWRRVQDVAIGGGRSNRAFTPARTASPSRSASRKTWRTEAIASRVRARLFPCITGTLAGTFKVDEESHVHYECAMVDEEAPEP